MASSSDDGSMTTSSDAAAGSLAFLGPVIVAALTALCLGYDAGVMSGAIAPIRQDFQLSAAQEGVVMGCINLVAAFGALVAGKLGDWKGRVPALLGTATILVLGPCIICVSQGFASLLAGRVITGVGVGLAFVLAPLYAAEVVPAHARAALISCTEILINGGVLLGYLSAMLLDVQAIGHSSGWRLVTGIAALPSLITLACGPWLPESPRWLLQAQRPDDAEESLVRLGASTPEAAAEQLREIKAAMAAEAAQQQATWAEILWPPAPVGRALRAGLGCALFQQLCGSEVIVYYTPTILASFRIHSLTQQNMGAIAVGLAKFFGSFSGAAFLDMVGRRPGVLVSCLGVAICLAGLALTAHANLGLVLLCLFMVFFELALAPAAFVLGTECYPVAVRAKGLALGMFTTRLLSGLAAVLFPSVLHITSLRVCLWVFCAASCLGVLWAWACVPETRGLALEQVTQLFEDPRSAGTATYGTLGTASCAATGGAS